MAFTKKQIENCAWLYEHFGEDEFISSAFMSRYEDEWVAKNGGQGLYIGTPRRHGMRRASGTVCTNMQTAGLLTRAWTGDRYGQYYKLSPAGKQVALDELDRRKAKEAGT